MISPPPHLSPSYSKKLQRVTKSFKELKRIANNVRECKQKTNKTKKNEIKNVNKFQSNPNLITTESQKNSVTVKHLRLLRVGDCTGD